MTGLPGYPYPNGYHWVSPGGRPKWVVTITLPERDGQKEEYSIELDEDYVCYHHGSWEPKKAEDAITAAIDRIVENERIRLRHDATNIKVEKLA